MLPPRPATPQEEEILHISRPPGMETFPSWGGAVSVPAHTDARGFGGEGQLHVQLGRPLLKSMVSNLLLFLSRPLGITARTRLWNEGRCPVSERVSHVDAILLSVS